MTIKLDDVDRQLVHLLQEDGRMSTREIAKRMRIAEGTVRSRIRRLSDNRVMRVMAVTDLEAAGYDLMLMLWIKVEGRPIRDVAVDLASVTGVLAVSILTGVYDISVTLALRDREEALRTIINEMSLIEGILDVDSIFMLDILKYESQWGPLIE